MLKRNVIDKNNPENKKKLFLVAVALVLVLAAGGGVYALQRRSDKAATVPPPAAPAVAPNTVNNAPATAAEKKAAEDNKDRLIQEIKDQANGTPTSQTVAPVITELRQGASGADVSVNAYVSGVFEDGGTCTVTATQGTDSITATSQAFANATTTDCAPITIARSKFGKTGDWSFVVSYNSDTSKGQTKASVLSVK